MLKIQTQRLHLIPLNLNQLEKYPSTTLEQALEFEVSHNIVTKRVRRAIDMKISKMKCVDSTEHAWYTYWLIVPKEAPYGAGLIGFKGVPNAEGETEIGYGVDSAYGNKGYMTEAVKRLITWAFEDERCKAVIAPDTKKENIASNRVLEKSGMRIYDEIEDALHWRIDKRK